MREDLRQLVTSLAESLGAHVEAPKQNATEQVTAARCALRRQLHVAVQTRDTFAIEQMVRRLVRLGVDRSTIEQWTKEAL